MGLCRALHRNGSQSCHHPNNGAIACPCEYGVSALGSAVLAIAEAVRALGGGAYLIQRKELAHENIRTTFTVSLIVTLGFTATLIVLAGPLTRYFNTPDLERYLLVSAIGYLMGPFVYPVFALMSRQMEFGMIARINAVSAVANAVTSILLAIMGFSYMSFAWAGVISAAAGMLLCFHFWRDRSIFRPLLSEWRSVGPAHRSRLGASQQLQPQVSRQHACLSD